MNILGNYLGQKKVRIQDQRVRDPPRTGAGEGAAILLWTDALDMLTERGTSMGD